MGVVNVHPSLLPDFRGAAPVARAILAGRTVTGVSFMVTDPGWDTGPLLSTAATGILPGETAGELSARLALIAAGRIAGVLSDYVSGRLKPLPQTGEGTYAEKISREDARLDWNRSAEELERAVRAFNPSPGAWTLFRGKVLKVHRARMVEGSGQTGTFTEDGGRLLAGTARGMLELLEVQPESGRSMDAGSFLRGVREAPER
jgi:methionyl-tRNA formyltransferase